MPLKGFAYHQRRRVVVAEESDSRPQPTITMRCIRCGKERPLMVPEDQLAYLSKPDALGRGGDTPVIVEDNEPSRWYTNGWLGHPELRWFACPQCFCIQSGQRECWELARKQLAKELS